MSSFSILHSKELAKICRQYFYNSVKPGILPNISSIWSYLFNIGVLLMLDSDSKATHTTRSSRSGRKGSRIAAGAKKLGKGLPFVSIDKLPPPGKPSAEPVERVKRDSVVSGRRRSMSVDESFFQSLSTQFSCRLEEFSDIKGRTWAYLSLYPDQQKKVQESKKVIMTKKELELFISRRNQLFFTEKKYRLCYQVQKLLNDFISPAYEKFIAKKRVESFVKSEKSEPSAGEGVKEISEVLKGYFNSAILNAIDSKLMGHPLLLDKIKDTTEGYTRDTKEGLLAVDEKTQETKFQIIVGAFEYNNLPEQIKCYVSKTEYDSAFNELHKVANNIDGQLRYLHVQVFNWHEQESIPHKIADKLPKVYDPADVIPRIWSDVVSEKMKGFYGDRNSGEAEKIKESISTFSNLGASIKKAIIDSKETSDGRVFVINADNDIKKLCISIFVDLSKHDSDKIVGAASWVSKNKKLVDSIIKNRVALFIADQEKRLHNEKNRKMWGK